MDMFRENTMNYKSNIQFFLQMNDKAESVY